MKNNQSIFDLSEPSSIHSSSSDKYEYATLRGLRCEGTTVFLYDRKHFLSVGEKTFFAVWKHHEGVFSQADEFYDSTTQKSVSQNDILAAVITHVLPQKLIKQMIKFAHRF